MLERNPKTNFLTGKKGSNKDDEDVKVPALTFALLEGNCYCCGKKGYRSNNCRHRNVIPYKEWAINKAKKAAKTKIQQHVQVLLAESSVTLLVGTKQSSGKLGTQQQSRTQCSSLYVLSLQSNPYLTTVPSINQLHEESYSS